MTFSIQIAGLQQFRQTMRAFPQRAKNAILAAAYLESADIMRTAQEQTPVDTGALRKSAWLEKPTAASSSIFGGFGAPYAIYVEMGNARHAVGKSRFLSDAIAARIPGLSNRIEATATRIINEVNDPLTVIPTLYPESPLFSTANLPPRRSSSKAKSVARKPSRKAKGRAAARGRR